MVDSMMKLRTSQWEAVQKISWAALGVLSAAMILNFTAISARAQSATDSNASSNDEGYTKQIREYTTESFFSTNLVDHLPASSTVPTPEKILGHIVGAPDVLTYSKDIYRYYDELAKASPRVKVFRVGKSEEGRDFVLVAVSDESNIAQLDHLKEITAKLADPRKISEAESQQLISTGKPFYWASGSIHSPESGSPEMLMELAYRLAVEDTPMIQNIRKNIVFLITPITEVDGHDRMVDWANYHKAFPDKPQPDLVYWGHYVQHDNNRDAIAMGLKLSQVMMKNFLDWHPQVLHDLHESIPYLYISTGTGPYNAWLDPIVESEWQKMAYNEIEQLTEKGVVGVWTHGFYDGWAPNYMFYTANGHNSIGRFYETFGNLYPQTEERTLKPPATSREWYRPNPPLPKVKWSLRNNINMQQSGLILGLDYMAQHPQEFLGNFYLKSKRSVAKATTEGPAAWAILNDGRRPALAAQLANLLQRQGAEVQKLDKEFEVTVPKENESKGEGKGEANAEKSETGKDSANKDAKKDASAKGSATKADAASSKKEEVKSVKIPAGSYVIRMDQPYSRIVDMLLDTQYYSTSDPRPYDDTGWTLGPLRNVKTLRITDQAILKAPMTLIDGSASDTDGGIAAPHAVRGKTVATKFYLIDANAEPNLAALRYRLKDAKVFAAEDSFSSGDEKFAAGSFIIAADGNSSDLNSQLQSAAHDLGVKVVGAADEPKVARHELKVPRIAVLHTWTSTQNEGWFRLALEESGIPYAYISDTVVRTTPNLREKYDVILFPPTFSDLHELLAGLPKRVLPDGTDAGPIPWQKSDVTPNWGGVDESPDIRGGLGFEGVANIKKFVEDGGLFVPVGSSTHLPVDLGLTDSVTITQTKALQVRGAIVRANVEDAKSPIAYGYDDSLGVYFNQAPVFKVALSNGGFFDMGGDDNARPSGRGSATEPDIPQGRVWTQPEPTPEPTRAEKELYVDPQLRVFFSSELPPASLYPRVVLRFADEKNLWISGMLAGGSELAGAPAVIDVPLGRGHIVLFANNPMWRQETQGSFMLVLNAALNFDHLDAGRQSPPAAKQ
jgi:hypothetical protein